MMRKPTGKEILAIVSFICGCIGMIEFSYFWFLFPRATVFGDQFLIVICFIGLILTYIGIKICGNIFSNSFLDNLNGEIS
jgi:hypothetical protein